MTATFDPLTPARDGVALRADGTLVHLRAARPDDREALRRLDAASSDTSLHYRYFSVSRELADRYTDRIAAEPVTARREAIVAEIDGELVGLACVEEVDGDPPAGEIAVQVTDHEQQEGIGTLLVEELVTIARQRRLHRLVADVLADNTRMLRVLRGLGLQVTSSTADGVTSIEIDLDDIDDYATALTARERRAEIHNLTALRAPRSIAVVGVGASEHSVGRTLVTNVVDGGFTGDVYVVSPHLHRIPGATTVAGIDDLPVPPDLVVVAVPAAAVPEVVESCGRRGARAILLLTAGFGETGSAGSAGERAVVAAVRRYGMRLVGPNCLGLVNTAPDVSLNATFAPMPMLPGGLALASQSGAVGIAVIGAAARRGLGLAEFVSMGNKADVSGNDLLLAWHDDPHVSVIALYLESVGNPRRFARIARSVSRTTPVLALKSGRTATGQRAGQSHTAAAAASEPVVDALFAQAGVQRVDTLEQLLDAVRVLDHQPLPRGRRVAVIGNSGGPGIIAADAAEAAGLDVVTLDDTTRAALRAAVPSLASDRNPVDLGAAVQPDEVAAAVAAVAGAEEVDCVVTVFTETRAALPEDVRAAVVAAATGSQCPVLAVEVGAVPCSVPLPGTTAQLPVFGFPEPALSALAVAVRAAAVRAAEPARTYVPSDADIALARSIVQTRLADAGAGWLAPDAAADVLRAVGARVIEQAIAHDTVDAVAAAELLGLPAVVKLTGDVHKSDIGGVRVDLRTSDDVGAAASELLELRPGRPVLVQPMHRGTELIIGALQDPRFGPVVMVGAGGVLTDLIGARSLRIAPLTTADLDHMLAEPHLAKLIDGYRGAEPVSRAALADLVARIGALVDAVPEIAEIDLNPVVCAGESLIVVDAKIHVTPARPAPDPLSRVLPMPASTTSAKEAHPDEQ